MIHHIGSYSHYSHCFWFPKPWRDIIQFQVIPKHFTGTTSKRQHIYLLPTIWIHPTQRNAGRKTAHQRFGSRISGNTQANLRTSCLGAHMSMATWKLLMVNLKCKTKNANLILGYPLKEDVDYIYIYKYKWQKTKLMFPCYFADFPGLPCPERWPWLVNHTIITGL